MTGLLPQAFPAEARPWTRWWWMGNALTEDEITAALEEFARVGIGGVEVSPIYGPRGTEKRHVSFLSPEWCERFAHTLREATRLGLGVDFIGGTGWPYGGPWVKREHAPRRVRWQEWLVPAQGLALPLKCDAEPEAELVAAVATGPFSVSRVLTSPALQEDFWFAPSDGFSYAPGDGWHIGGLFLGHTEQQVKRAAPGGEGNVLDPFDKNAVTDYLRAFDAPLTQVRALLGDATIGPGCIFNDSFEVFGAEITPRIFDEFVRRRGYDLRPFLPALFAKGAKSETVVRVRADYRETIGDLLHGDFTCLWHEWAHKHGLKTRNQAHGSPGNLLDLYAVADVPETEIFGPARNVLAGQKPLTPQPPDWGQEQESLVSRMASSAAHIAGRTFCSSESFTWLGEHGHVSLESAKAEADLLFTLGINRIFFHGTPASPPGEPWPGWLFYATTHFGPTNPWWRDVPAFCAYLSRCQWMMQQGVPDNDLLVYFPYPELLHGEAADSGLLLHLTVHRTNRWLKANLPDWCEACHELEQGGYTFDFISDRQSQNDVELRNGGLVARKGGAQWQAILVAGCRMMPLETLEQLLRLAQSGATVLFLGTLPSDVPGHFDLPTRRARLNELLQQLTNGITTNRVEQFTLGTGRVLVGSDLSALLAVANIARESLADVGIEFARRRNIQTGARTYFLSNPGTNDFAGWVTLTHGSEALLAADPTTGETGTVPIRQAENGRQFYLQLPAGSSLIAQTGVAEAEAYPPLLTEAAGEAITLAGNWRAEFIAGGPALPDARSLKKPSRWTDWTDTGDTDRDARRVFSGTCRYTCVFDWPDVAKSEFSGWRLDLGEVCHSARVRINGHEAATVFARPFALTLAPESLKLFGNVLEIEVTNLMANRLADLERREGAAWRPFLMVDIFYKPFENAAQWETVPSGLAGPVMLTPQRAQKAEK